MDSKLILLMTSVFTALTVGADDIKPQAKPNVLFILADPNETSNVANANPARAERLKKMVIEWKGTHPATPNPDCISKYRDHLSQIGRLTV